MQMPMPPVSQCRARQTARACQVKEAGRNASRAPTCSPAIQRREPQAIPADTGRVVVDGISTVGIEEGGSLCFRSPGAMMRENQMPGIQSKRCAGGESKVDFIENTTVY